MRETIVDIAVVHAEVQPRLNRHNQADYLMFTELLGHHSCIVK